jgi:hypothetical protein
MQDGKQFYELDKLNRQEREVRAQQSSQWQHVLSTNGKPDLYSQALAQLGKVLSTLGYSLQERYGTADDEASYEEQPEYRRRIA